MKTAGPKLSPPVRIARPRPAAPTAPTAPTTPAAPAASSQPLDAGRAARAIQPLRSPSIGASLRSRLAALGLIIAWALPAGAFVYQTPTEFTATGDFDGDGREDIVVVDRVTGNYRVAHQLVAGQHSWSRSEEHTSELQSRRDLVCRLLLEKKKNKKIRVLYESISDI